MKSHPSIPRFFHLGSLFDPDYIRPISPFFPLAGSSLRLSSSQPPMLLLTVYLQPP
ncbi:hypothetical protein LINGRAHAP2_LOCUS372 [Linum grandiflorum]